VRTGIRTDRRIPRMGTKMCPRRETPWYPLSQVITNPDPQNYLLHDKEAEKKWNTTLVQTVIRARANNRQLFKDYQVYLSNSVHGHQALLGILETNGAEVRVVSNSIKGRAKVLRTDYLKTAEKQVLVCRASSDDKVLRDKFREEVKEGGLNWGLYTSEWIMISVLRQEIEKGDENAILT
jgi:hypothetical protein